MPAIKRHCPSCCSNFTIITEDVDLVGFCPMCSEALPDDLQEECDDEDREPTEDSDE